MTENEWTRLTAEGIPGDVRSRRDDTGAFVTHEIDDTYGVVTLTNPELLALVRVTEAWREVPEVKALVEAVDALPLGTLGHDWDRHGNGGMFRTVGTALAAIKDTQ